MPMDAAGGYIVGAFTPEQREKIAEKAKEAAKTVVAGAQAVNGAIEHAVLHPIETIKEAHEAVVHEAKEVVNIAKRGLSEVLNIIEDNPGVFLAAAKPRKRS